MRTDEEILMRINERKDEDWSGREIAVLVARLPFSLAAPYLRNLRPDFRGWIITPRDRISLVQAMFDYMPTAWDKANRKLGISASLSMRYYNALTWLAGDDLGDLTDYKFYGKDNLVRICKHYGWDSTQWDDGIRSNG